MNILLTSVGRRGYLVQYFKEALNGLGKVYVSNSDSNSAAFKYADEYVVSPLIYDNHYIDFLLNYCKKNNIKLLISLFDIDLYVLACNKSKFEEIGVNVVVSDKEFVKICNDKWLTYNYLKDNKIETPKTFLSIETAIEALKNNEISFPLIIKPRWGMGSLEIFTADNENELRIFYNKIKRDIWNSYLKYESNQDRDNCVIIQKKISGDEYGVDLINDLDGNHISTIIRKKIAMRSGETDAAEIVENKMINNMMSKLAKISNHIGNLDVDILKDDNDKYYILEMNARFGGGYPFSHLAGVDLPLALIKWLNNEKVDIKLLTAKVGVIGRKDIKIIQINNSIRR
ncbi:ATP-grasp domain-containing protein [Erysipelatoclostridium sp. An173]|uniref:ATP-grasp domain-containing protein n=1 Tax=Erysipelatoclostridium sp. An173 TaxID=1965571 RepID=UPI0032092076